MGLREGGGGGEKGGENSLFNVTQEPQIGYMPHASQDIDKLTPTYECHPKECGAGSNLGVVQIPSLALGPVRGREDR